MIKHLISDLSKTLIFVKDQDYPGKLNELYQELKASNQAVDYEEFFFFDQDLIDFYHSLDFQTFNIFTAGILQEEPVFWNYLSSHFDNIFSAVRLGVSKAEPEGYLKIAELLQAEPQELLFIDDQPFFIEAAEKAGLVTIPYQGLPELKKRIPSSLSA